jgi:hypothetical protein
MPDRFIDTLRDWQTFYLLVGGAAAVLIGLLFVAISLARDLAIGTEHASMRVFVTPAVVHLGIVLFVSTFCVMPVQRSAVLGVLILLLGVVGLSDAGATIAPLWRGWHGRLADGQDWFWRAALPLASSLALLGGGGWLIVGASAALPWLAGVTVVLLAMAIRNAWGLTTWMVEHRQDQPEQAGRTHPDVPPGTEETVTIERAGHHGP